MRKPVFPLMKRKVHEKELQQLRHHQTEILREEKKRLNQDKADLQAMIEKLHKIGISYNPDYNNFRLVLDFSDRIVYALERGNDDRMIDYIVEEMAYKIKRELKSMNIQRPADLGLRRWHNEIVSQNGTNRGE